MQNITIDDKNTTAIQYYPPACRGSGWTFDALNGLAHEGSYQYCDSSPRAVFDFTGVAVYYMLPGFINGGSMFFRLDDRPAVEVNLTSPTGSDTPTHVVWSAVGLPNSPHSLELLPGQLGFVDVDAIIYTRLAESNTNTTSPTPSASPQPAESSSSTLALGLGIALGVLAAIVVAFGAFYLGRRSRARRSKASSASTSPGTATAAADMQPGDPDYYQPTTELITPYPKRQPTMTSMNQYGMPPTTYPHRQATMRSTNPNPMSPTSVYDEESAISGDHEGSSSHHPTVLTFYPMHPSNHYSSKHPLPEDVDPDHEKKRGNAISPPPMYSVQNN